MMRATRFPPPLWGRDRGGGCLRISRPKHLSTEFAFPRSSPKISLMKHWVVGNACALPPAPPLLGGTERWGTAPRILRTMHLSTVYACPAQIPKISLRKREVVAIDCALARSSSLFFGTEKPWPAPL